MNRERRGGKGKRKRKRGEGTAVMAGIVGEVATVDKVMARAGAKKVEMKGGEVEEGI